MLCNYLFTPSIVASLSDMSDDDRERERQAMATTRLIHELISATLRELDHYRRKHPRTRPPKTF
jgi:hypothetical protein